MTNIVHKACNFGTTLFTSTNGLMCLKAHSQQMIIFLRSYTIFLLKFPCHVINSVPIFGENHPKSTTELDSLQQILVLSYKVTFMVKTC